MILSLIMFSCCGLYKGYPNWIKVRNPRTNSINKNDNKWIQFAATVTLNHGEIKKYLQRIN